MQTIAQSDTGSSRQNDPLSLPLFMTSRAVINCDRKTQVVPYFKNTVLVTRNLNTSYRFQMTTKVLGAARGSPTLRSNVSKNIIDFISRVRCVKTVNSVSRRARFFSFPSQFQCRHYLRRTI